MATAAKLILQCSALAALALLAWLGADEWRLLLPATAATFGLGFTLARRWPPLAWAPLLLPAYVLPVLFLATRGVFLPAYHAVWFGGLLGAILAVPGPARWHLPPAWRLPLAFWALAVGLAWPLVAYREMNFSWASLGQYHLANSGLGGPPPVVIVGMLVAVLTQLLGILWFDAMFAAFGGKAVSTFRRRVVVPLLASLALGSLLAVYQIAVDINFLSAHQWPFYKRAAGGLLNGNAFGALAGLWTAPALSLALTGAPGLMAGGLLATLLYWGGLWATGSRMALLAGSIGLAITGYTIARARRGDWRRLVIVAVALLVTISALLALGRSRMDPISRTIDSLTNRKRPTVAKIIEFELWNRFGPFGTASVRMIKDSPVVGIGTGAFEVLLPDYAHVVTGGKTRAHFDNAQSWYRHRLAELGWLGSLGWLTWIGLFGAFLWKAAPSRDGLTEATGVKAAMLALAAISLVSMPTRNAFVALTFWVFAFWLVRLTTDDATAVGPRRLASASDRPWCWAVVWGLAILFAAGTGWVGYRDLRPPYRALMADWNYLNGVSRPVRTPEGIRRYAGEHGVAVFGVRPGYLKLVFQLPHDDAAREPVRVRIYSRDALVANLLVADNAPHTLYVRVPEAASRMMIQTRVSRLASGADGAAGHGLILHNWTFVARVPADGMVGEPADQP